MISVNNIVDVDFKVLTSKSSIGTYKTVVYIIPQTITSKDTSDEVGYLLCSSVKDLDNYNFINSLSVSEETIVKSNVSQFFLNGGVQLLLMTCPTEYTLSSFQELIEKAKGISEDFIYVVLSNTLWGDSRYSTDKLIEICSWIENLPAPETIRLLLTKNLKTDNTFDFTKINDEITSKFSNYSVAIKHCSKTNNGVLVDAALLIGAYFSQINLNGSDTILDYCYTKETLSLVNTGDSASEEVTQSDYSKLMSQNYNFIDSVGTNIINFGGNLMNGVPISTDFATICVENDVCATTLNEMMGKQYLNQIGLTRIISSINTQMSRYIDNGYINKGSNYSGDGLYIRYNGKDYTVVEQGELLVNGYKVFAVPVSAISVEDKANKQFPPIYVIIESLAGARTIKINGTVR